MPEMTTAAALLAYEKELNDGGLSADLVDSLVRDAAHHIVRDSGLGVTNA